ncbi:MAG TPA: UDP binding domain-containing protein, partial [Ardenticatenaceae bacterium]|nr:UDP binding domain-containing protein [Ardenticatenaceae bacterium]
FIALGTVIRDFLNPDFTLIGESDERAGALLEACYAEILENGAPCRRMSFENAELAKIALNAYVTTKITFANMLAELCELLPGGDVDVVTGALGLDSRIGRKYLTGGAAYGGPCFPRDNLALESFARSLGRAALLPQATDRMNRAYVERLAKRLKGELRAGATVAVLGLAYKPLSHVIEESQGIHLARALDCLGMRVVAYDPLAGDGARLALGGGISVLADVGACLDQADAVAITTPDAAFRALRAADFPRREPPIVVLDCWRLLRPELAGSDRVRYLSVGVGPDEPELAARLDAVTRNATHP